MSTYVTPEQVTVALSNLYPEGAEEDNFCIILTGQSTAEVAAQPDSVWLFDLDALRVNRGDGKFVSMGVSTALGYCGPIGEEEPAQQELNVDGKRVVGRVVSFADAKGNMIVRKSGGYGGAQYEMRRTSLSRGEPLLEGTQLVGYILTNMKRLDGWVECLVAVVDDLASHLKDDEQVMSLAEFAEASPDALSLAAAVKIAAKLGWIK